MEKYDVYKEMSKRTGGDIYIGVVGPVRTGKSTFISKFVEKLVLPNISNKLQKQIATDEMPQSADGKTIMTTQPKFVPANAVKVQFKNKSTANVKLVDCVGYLIDGVSGHTEDGKQRLVKTPWSDKEMPFEKAAEIGTKKVIDEYSTIGVVVTTDGTISDIPRENYVKAEERVINELKVLNKPFIVVLNTKNEKDENALHLADEMQKKYGVSVVVSNVLNLDGDGISEIMEKILLEFPMNGFNVDIPDWMQALPVDNKYIKKIISALKSNSLEVNKMRDFAHLTDLFSDDDDFSSVSLTELNTGEGFAEYSIKAKDGLFYKVLSIESGEEISNNQELIGFIRSFSGAKHRFDKIKQALDDAEETGYGIVVPCIDEMNLEEPELVKQGGRYGVKLKATAPSLHIMKVDVQTEVAPIVGTEKQGEDMCKYLMGRFEDNPAEIWNTDMFGKPLHDLVKEGMNGKIIAMPKDAQGKIRKTLTKIINENKGGIICILL